MPTDSSVNVNGVWAAVPKGLTCGNVRGRSGVAGLIRARPGPGGDRGEGAGAQDRGLLVCDDWNIAHTEADIRNWRGNVKGSGFLPHERAWLGALFDPAVERHAPVTVVSAA